MPVTVSHPSPAPPAASPPGAPAPVPTPVYAEPLRLAPSLAVGEAMASIFHNCLVHFSANAPAVLAGDHPEAVHQMRVGLRRFRSALAIFKPVLVAEEVAALQEPLERILDVLAPVRDRDVFLADILGAMAPEAGHESERRALAAVIARQRARALRAARTAIAGRPYGDALARLTAWTCEHDRAAGLDMLTGLWHRRRIDEFAPRALGRRHRRLLKIGRGFASLSVPQRHRVRIAVKKMRYLTEFFAALFPHPRRRRFLKALRCLQQDLGHLNDIALAEPLVAAAIAQAGRRQRAVAAAGSFLAGWHACALASLESAMVADWERFAAAPAFWRPGKDDKG